MGELTTNRPGEPIPRTALAVCSHDSRGLGVRIKGRPARSQRHRDGGRRARQEALRERRHRGPWRRIFCRIPSPMSFPLYKAVAADLIVLVVVCGAQMLLFPAWGLPGPSISRFLPFWLRSSLSAKASTAQSIDGSVPHRHRSRAWRDRSCSRSALICFSRSAMNRAPPRYWQPLPAAWPGLVCIAQVRRFAWTRRGHETESRNVLIVGGGPSRADRLRERSATILCTVPPCVRGSVDDDLPLSATVLGRIADLDWLARAEFIDEVILALPGRPAQTREAAEAAFRNHLDIRAVPDLPPGHWPEAGVDFIGEIPVVTLHREPVPSAALFLKRAARHHRGDHRTCRWRVRSWRSWRCSFVWNRPARSFMARSAPAPKAGVSAATSFARWCRTPTRLKANLQAQNQREGPIFKIVDDPGLPASGASSAATASTNCHNSGTCYSAI